MDFRGDKAKSAAGVSPDALHRSPSLGFFLDDDSELTIVTPEHRDVARSALCVAAHR